MYAFKYNTGVYFNNSKQMTFIHQLTHTLGLSLLQSAWQISVRFFLQKTLY